MRALTLLIISCALACVGFSGEFVPVDTSDDRVVAEVEVSVSTDTLPADGKGSLFLIPAGLATKEEKAAGRALIMEATNDPKRNQAWGYAVTVAVDAQSISFELYSNRFEANREVTREAAFALPLFSDAKGKKAGIGYTITWKKRPNQPPEPMPQKRHGSP